MIELDFDDRAVRGLHGYVRQVSDALGLRGECSCVQSDAPLSAYIALDGRLRSFPDHDVALLWDEHHGWSAAIEQPTGADHHRGADLLVVAYLGEDLLPPPDKVAEWTAQLFQSYRDTGKPLAQPELVRPDNLPHRLTAYLDTYLDTVLTTAALVRLPRIWGRVAG